MFRKTILTLAAAASMTLSAVSFGQYAPNNGGGYGSPNPYGNTQPQPNNYGGGYGAP